MRSYAKYRQIYSFTQEADSTGSASGLAFPSNLHEALADAMPGAGLGSGLAWARQTGFWRIIRVRARRVRVGWTEVAG